MPRASQAGSATLLPGRAKVATMQDGYKDMMYRSFKDARDIVADYNEWSREAFDQEVAVPPGAVPQVALVLYQSRVRGHLGESAEFDMPEFDERMYE